MARIDRSTRESSLRLWPGIAIVVVQWVARFVVPAFVPEAGLVGAMAGFLGGVAIVVWWLFLSRAPWTERVGALVLMGIALAATPLILHESIRTGAMGMLFFLYAVPVVSLALVAWAVVSRRFEAAPRRALLVVAIALSCGMWALVQTAGFDGAGDSDFSWRWAKTAEDRLLAQDGAHPVAAARASQTTARVVRGDADWPGFRGPRRDSIIPGVRIETDWEVSPPVELWRRSVGPGWSSFAVFGDVFYTQEQRGDDEVVACYDATTGEPVWMHRDAARFWESNAGAGPRGTPTVLGGRVYAFGATGLLNVLDADTGGPIWSRDVAADTGVEVPTWGFSSSPLVIGEVVVVAAAGQAIAYELETGARRWLGPDGGAGYSSPHRLTVDGVEQVVLLSADGATGFAPTDGTVLWEHAWSGYPIVQPTLTADGDLLISASESSGVRRLAVRQGPSEWTAEERWTSLRLKPYFSDFVVHEGHAFGFDGAILASIEVDGGTRNWKGGRYGHGQLVLLSDQDLLLVLSERGELALVSASPDQFTELARVPAVKGKTWNHPVLVGDLLLVRNSEEMVAFRLSRAAI